MAYSCPSAVKSSQPVGADARVGHPLFGPFLLGQTTEAATDPAGGRALTGHHRCSGLKGASALNQPEV